MTAHTAPDASHPPGREPLAQPLLTPTVADVDLERVCTNARLLKDRAGKAGVVAVVKADAYGHGAARVAGALRAQGFRRFAVATVPEGIALREAGIEDEILVFAGPLPEFLPAYAQHELGVTVSSRAVVDAVADAARAFGPLRVHLKIDTGMTRLGVRPEEAAAAVRQLEATRGVTLASVWTHLATADAPDPSFATEQLERFRATIAPFEGAVEHVHVGNSAALLRVPDCVALFDRPLVRTGIALYGLTDLEGLAEEAGLRPAMRLTSRVTQIRTVEPGTTISYGRLWRAERPTRIATVGAGYADGYHRLLSNRAQVGIRGGRYPVAGAICMDMFMVDVGPPGGSGSEVEVGDEVVLFGDGGPSALEVARWAETIPYEVLTSVARRVPRRYLGIP